MLSVLALLTAGGLGAVSRAVLDALGRGRTVPSAGIPATAHRPAIPWPTTAINVGGSFVAGVVAGTVGSDAGPGTLGAIVAIGYLGAFTTFSTAMLQTAELLLAGARIPALVHAVLPLVASVGAATVGWAIVA